MTTNRVAKESATKPLPGKGPQIQNWEDEGGTVITDDAWRAYQNSARDELDSSTSTLETFKAQALNLSDSAQATAKKALENAEVKLHAAKETFDGLHEASKPAWHELKVGMERALNELRAAWSKASNCFGENEKKQ